MEANKTKQPLCPGYLREGELGTGSMGEVWLARRKLDGQRYAVKRARPSRQSLKELLTELHAWIGLPRHPNIVPCHFFRVIGQEVWIFSEYITHGSLADAIMPKRNGEIPFLYRGGKDRALARVLEYAIQSAWGLQCIHDCGLVHRDIKPSNILVGGHGRDVIKIADFGLAPTATRQTHEKVNLAYAAPEQGLHVSPQSDIWSWALVALAMFRGDAPIGQDTDGRTPACGWEATEKFETYLAEGQPGARIHIPDGLVRLFRASFRPEPEDRPESLDEIASILVDCYRSVFGEGPPLSRPVASSQPVSIRNDRTAGTEGVWSTPSAWHDVLIAHAPDHAPKLLRLPAKTVRAGIVADLVDYEVLVEDMRGAVDEDKLPIIVYSRFLRDKGNIHERVGDFATADDLFKESLEALTHLGEVRSDDPSVLERERTRLRIANLLIRRERPAEALPELDDIVRVLSHDIVVHDDHTPSDLAAATLDRSRASLALDRLDAAENDLRFSQTLLQRQGPESKRLIQTLTTVYLNLAVIYREHKQADKALEIAQNALRAEDRLEECSIQRRAKILIQTALIHGDRRQPLEALELLRRAEDLLAAPRNEEDLRLVRAWCHLVHAQMLEGGNRLEEALAQIDEALELLRALMLEGWDDAWVMLKEVEDWGLLIRDRLGQPAGNEEEVALAHALIAKAQNLFRREVTNADEILDLFRKARALTSWEKVWDRLGPAGDDRAAPEAQAFWQRFADGTEHLRHGEILLSLHQLDQTVETLDSQPNLVRTRSQRILVRACRAYAGLLAIGGLSRFRWRYRDEASLIIDTLTKVWLQSASATDRLLLGWALSRLLPPLWNMTPLADRRTRHLFW